MWIPTLAQVIKSVDSGYGDTIQKIANSHKAVSDSKHWQTAVCQCEAVCLTNFQFVKQSFAYGKTTVCQLKLTDCALETRKFAPSDTNFLTVWYSFFSVNASVYSRKMQVWRTRRQTWLNMERSHDLSIPLWGLSIVCDRDKISMSLSFHVIIWYNHT